MTAARSLACRTKMYRREAAAIEPRAPAVAHYPTDQTNRHECICPLAARLKLQPADQQLLASLRAQMDLSAAQRP